MRAAEGRGPVPAPSAAARLEPPPNDRLEDALLVNGVPSTSMGSSAAATTDADELASACGRHSGGGVWFRFEPPAAGAVRFETVGSDYDTVLSVWMGVRHPLREIACNDDADGRTLTSGVEMAYRVGQTYLVKVEGNEGATGSLVTSASWGRPASPPGNDDLRAASVLEGLPFTDTVDTTGATDESGEAASACERAAGRGAWYRYVGARDGGVRFDTSGSAFDTVASVWSGSDHPLRPLACSGDADRSVHDSSSAIQMRVRAGAEYLLRIEGSRGLAGLFTLRADLLGDGPPGDHLADATRVTSLPFTAAWDTENATTEEAEGRPSCVSDSGRGVWVAIELPGAASVVVDASGSDHAVVLSTWRGDAHPLDELSCAGPTAPGARDGESRLTFDAAAGARYLVKAEGLDDRGGRLELSIRRASFEGYLPVAYRAGAP